jgi:hypothetical protein
MAQHVRANDPPELLNIPREIRQKILYYTFSTSLSEDIGLFYNIILFSQTLSVCLNPILDSFATKTMSQPIPTPHIHDMAHALNQVHPIISVELGFVVNQRLKEFNTRDTWLVGEVQKEMPVKRERWEHLVPGSTINRCTFERAYLDSRERY